MAAGAPPALVERLDAMAQALEQGGNTLIGHLIDDLAGHVPAEDAALFPRFSAGGRRRT